MSTGYTSIIDDGGTFNDYVMRCVRGIGYLYRMRDDPLDAEIPEEIKPEDHHKVEADKSRARVSELLETTINDATGYARKEFSESVKNRQEALEQHAVIKAAYDAMRLQVQEWTPPTPEHEYLKEFMLSQIEIGKPLNYGYSAPILLTGEQWLAKKMEHFAKSLAYHEDEYRKEVARCTKASMYLNALCLALDGEPR